MKKIALSLSLLAMFAVSGFAQESAKTATVAAENPNQADIKFDKMTHDYGTIKKGADPYCQFEVGDVTQ